MPKIRSLIYVSSVLAALAPVYIRAQTSSDNRIEEMLVVGTQIRGAAVSDALAVTVLDEETIVRLGVISGDELMALIPENGQNYFNDGENYSGGINAARGDVSAFNLRNLGTGNTLILLNGRRMVNTPAYQTEEIGGSFVPVNSVNSNTIPVGGLSRLEVLRDGASAIYGADAVAGVVNNVMKTNFEGLSFSGKILSFDHLDKNDFSLSAEWGKNFNEGRTNVSSFFSFYSRERVKAADDPRWANADFSSRVPEDSLWFDDAAFRNDSINSQYAQYDLVGSASSAGLNNVITDSSGEFETFPVGDERCQYNLGYNTCGGIDGQGTYRYNLNESRDLASQLDRFNSFISITHEISDELESFSELAYYQASTQQRDAPETSLTSSKLRVGASNYWNPLGPCGSPNRLPDEVIGTDVPCEGLELEIDNYRFVDAPLDTKNDGDSWRLLQGLRGSLGKWDWETALVYSKATQDDVTPNRLSNSLLQEALLDSSPNAYNPFSGGINSNIERAEVTVKRHNESELIMLDGKISSNDLWQLPGGVMGLLAGFEARQESFLDDRDDRLDGTIVFTDWEGDTYPYVSDVIGSSPTPDSEGSRDVISVFGELELPLLSTLDVQLALRYENFSDTDDPVVGKLAFGWQALEQIMLRGSASQAFRAPNLITINEEIVARNNTRTDWVCQYAIDNADDPDAAADDLDCNYSMQRIAQGSDQLEPEKSFNTSIGLVLTPVEGLTLTIDYWSIEKENTIGLVGEENHTLIDLVARIEAGTANCGSFTGNPALNRLDADLDLESYYQEAGICPAGDVAFVDDRYANLDTRRVEGHDIGIYYNVDSAAGEFSFRYNGAFIDRFEQEAGGTVVELVESQEAGILPLNYPVVGFADLIGMDGNQKERHSAQIAWGKANFSASLGAYKIGEFYQSSLTLEDGTRYIIPSMTTYDATLGYLFEVAQKGVQVTFGIKNLTDERAPLADRYFGFLTDAHSDYGRYYYLSSKLTF